MALDQHEVRCEVTITLKQDRSRTPLNQQISTLKADSPLLFGMVGFYCLGLSKTELAVMFELLIP